MGARLFVEAAAEGTRRIQGEVCEELAGLRFEHVREEDGLDSLIVRRASEFDVLVIGPGCAEPVKIAEQAAAVDPQLSVLLLCASAAEHERVGQALRFSAFLGRDVVCHLLSGEEAVASTVQDAASRTLQRRSYHALIDEVGSSTVAVRSFPLSPVAFLDRILDHAPIGVAALNGDGRVVAWNRRAEAMFGHSEQEAIGSRLEALLPAGGGAQIAELMARSRSSPSATGAVTLDAGPKHRAARHLEVLVSSLMDPREEPGWIVLVQDVTRRTEEMELLRRTSRELAERTEELSRANRDLEEFTFIASHDLQEPLRKLASFSALLEADVGDDLSEAARADLHFIGDGARRMKKLVQDLLTLSRTGTAAAHREPVDIDECANRALENLEIVVRETGASFSRDPLPTVDADSSLLTILYQNLIANALKFSAGQRPEIHLTAERSSEGWILGVKDQGIGIAVDHQDEVFKTFRRLHSNDQYPGTGIGLAICRKVVERHGGWIRVESAPGQGAHFRFHLG